MVDVFFNDNNSLGSFRPKQIDQAQVKNKNERNNVKFKQDNKEGANNNKMRSPDINDSGEPDDFEFQDQKEANQDDDQQAEDIQDSNEQQQSNIV